MGLLEVASNRKFKLLEDPDHSVVQARFDPQDEWIAFTLEENVLRARIYIARFDPARIDEERGIEKPWIQVTDRDDGWDGMARWSPNGNFLYFVSDRQGSRGIWVQELNPKTKNPVAKPRIVHRFEQTRLSLSGVLPSSLRINVAKERIVFSLREMTGNIWMATLGEQH